MKCYCSCDLRLLLLLVLLPAMQVRAGLAATGQQAPQAHLYGSWVGPQKSTPPKALSKQTNTMTGFISAQSSSSSSLPTSFSELLSSSEPGLSASALPWRVQPAGSSSQAPPSASSCRIITGYLQRVTVYLAADPRKNSLQVGRGWGWGWGGVGWGGVGCSGTHCVTAYLAADPRKHSAGTGWVGVGVVVKAHELRVRAPCGGGAGQVAGRASEGRQQGDR